MSGPVILLLVGLAYAGWGSVLAIRWFATRKIQREVYVKYIEDGTLKTSVSEEEFAKMFMRVEGPRFGLYMFAAACLLPFVIVFVIKIFNSIWTVFWKGSGELPWFEVGELPHSLFLVFLYVGVLIGVAWVTMRHYHLTAPGSFKTEMKRLNGDLE